LLTRPAIVVKGNDALGGAAHVRHDEADAWIATGMIAGIESSLDLLSQPCKKPRKSSKDQPPAA
jgi:hypothetical protein